MSKQSTQDNISLFYRDIQMPAGYNFNTVDTIKKSLSYYEGHFIKGGEKDNLGLIKNFFNITKSVCDTATKFIDLDTKDIMFFSANGEQFEKIWLLQKDFHYWIKKSKFAKLLNKIAFNYPKGHVIIKQVRGGWERVPITNIRCLPEATNLEKSPFVYEPLTMSRGEIEEMGWNKTDVIEAMFAEYPDCENFLLYDCYEKSGKKWKREIKAIIFSKQEQQSAGNQLQKQEEVPTEYILHADEIKRLPYRELKWEEVDGRWLGFGFPEYLFPNQIRRNEIKHLEKVALYLKALQAWTSSDDTIGNNLIKDIQTGQIIKTREPLQIVPRDNVDLSAYNNERQDWDMNTTRKTFDTDIARGDSLPSNTPLGLGQLQAQMTMSYFDGKREDFGLFIEELLHEDIFPSFKKERRKRHNLMIAHNDKDFKKMVKILADNIVKDRLIKYVKETGDVPYLSDIEVEKQKLEQSFLKNKQLSIDIPESFYDDLEVDIDIVITGENMNLQNKFNALNTAFTALLQNPQVLQDPKVRKVFSLMLELQGVSPLDILEDDDEIQPTMMQAIPMMGQMTEQMGQPQM